MKSSAATARAAQVEDEASLLAEAVDDHGNGDDDELDVPLAELWRRLKHGGRGWIRVPVGAAPVGKGSRLRRARRRRGGVYGMLRRSRWRSIGGDVHQGDATGGPGAVCVTLHTRRGSGV